MLDALDIFFIILIILAIKFIIFALTKDKAFIQHEEENYHHICTYKYKTYYKNNITKGTNYAIITVNSKIVTIFDYSYIAKKYIQGSSHIVFEKINIIIKHQLIDERTYQRIKGSGHCNIK